MEMVICAGGWFVGCGDSGDLIRERREREGGRDREREIREKCILFIVFYDYLF
ncbi:hypothetical protein HanRHA438_Chr02g0092031 [Helianthus annuus]|nr:hypothetical protein HanRHA438_Chr02g0092031 [Helianthus annuus]